MGRLSDDSQPAGTGTYSSYVVHGATAGTSRPTSTGPVLWIGSVTPTNATAGDEWRDTTTDPYTVKIRGASTFTQVGGTPLASGVAVTPSGSVSSTNVQAALLEIAADYATADTNLRLIAGYGATSGAPNSPQGTAARPPLGPNLFAAATGGLGAGYSTASSGSLTAASTTQSLIWRINVGNISGNSQSNADEWVRFTFDFSNTVTTGWGGGLFYEFVDTGGTLVAGQARNWIVTQTQAVTNYQGVIEALVPAGAVNMHIGLALANNTTSGVVTLNSGDLRRVGYSRPPLVVGWQAGTPNASSGVFRVFQGLIDPTTRATNWVSTDLSADGVLESGYNTALAWPTTGAWSRNVLDLSGSQSQASPTVVRTGTAVTMHVNNNSHVMGIINGSGAQELRCNTHGGETGRSGTFATDYTFEYDLGNGVWTACKALSNIAQLCKRFRYTQHTKVLATTGETVAYIDYIWTFFDDGTIRQDRTVTFQRTQAMYQWFVWMTSFQPSGSSGPFIAQGRLGAGQNVHGQVDYRYRVTVPTISSVTTSTSGGTLPAATKNYRITRRTTNGETTASAAVAQASTGTTSSNTVTFPASVTGQTSWGVYDDNGLLGYVPVATTSYVDTGAVGAGAQPPTVNNGWFSNGTTLALDNAQSTLADWCVYREATTGICFSKVINRDDILAQHPSAVAVRAELLAATGVVKNYFHIEGLNGGGLPASSPQANGVYPVTIPTGTVVTNTSWDFMYLPLDLTRYEAEQTVRATNASQLGTIYPAA